MQWRIDFDAGGEGQFTGDASEVAEHGRHLAARLAIPPELERAAYRNDVGPDIRVQLRCNARKHGHALAVDLLQFRLVLKDVDLADAAGHGQEDAILRSRRMVGRVSGRLGRCPGVLR